MATEDDRERAITLYKETTLPVHRIAEIFGVSRQTTYNWLTAAGATGERKPVENGSELLLMQSTLDEVVQNQRSGLVELANRQEAMLVAVQRLAMNSERMLGLMEGFMAANERIQRDEK